MFRIAASAFCGLGGFFGGCTGFARGDLCALALQVGSTTTTFFDLVALLSHINLYIRGLFRLCSGTMDIARLCFNIYLPVALSAALFCGCASGKKNKKVVTLLQVHAVATDKSSFTKKVSVFREAPVTMRVDDSPLLTEADVKEAAVVEALGGFALAIQFGTRGRWLLDQHSSMHKGRNLVIFARFGEKEGIKRWIAAPILSNRITDGALIFTPDATREEAEMIARGLGEPKKKGKKEESAEKEKLKN